MEKEICMLIHLWTVKNFSTRAFPLPFLAHQEATRQEFFYRAYIAFLKIFLLVQLETEIASGFLFSVYCRKHTWQFPTLVLRHQNFMITQKPVLTFSVTESRCMWGSGLFVIRHNLSNVLRAGILAKAGICALASYYNFASLFLPLTVLLDMICEAIRNMLQPLRLEQDLLFHSEELKYMSHLLQPCPPGYCRSPLSGLLLST